MTEKEFIAAIYQHSGIIQKILYLYVDNAEDKRDLQQEIHLQAWKSIGKFRGDALFSTWLYRIALNTVLSFHRKHKIKGESLDQIREPVISESTQSDESEMLLRAIKQLNDIDKAIITLHLEGYDNPEIAEIIGLTKNNLGVKLHRIKDHLKRKLNQTTTWTS